MCRMWANSVVPDTAGAKFVVSENGDILSPKYAADTTAPAVTAGGIPIPDPMPTMATPKVPAVVQALPVATATMEHTNRQVTKKNFGDRIFSP